MAACICGHVLEVHNSTGCRFEYNCGCKQFSSEKNSDTQRELEELQVWRAMGATLRSRLSKKGRDAIRALDPQLDVEMTRISLLLQGELERAKRLTKL